MIIFIDEETIELNEFVEEEGIEERTPAMKIKEFRENLAAQFINLLEEKQLEWKREWDSPGAPKNGKVSKKI